jgi:hypothetical protein
MPLEPAGNGTSNGTKPKWAPILGQWEITEPSQKFLGDGRNAAAHGQVFPMGLAVSNAVMPNGTCRVKMRFSAAFGGNEQAGGIVLQSSTTYFLNWAPRAVHILSVNT